MLLSLSVIGTLNQTFRRDVSQATTNDRHGTEARATRTRPRPRRHDAAGRSQSQDDVLPRHLSCAFRRTHRSNRTRCRQPTPVRSNAPSSCYYCYLFICYNILRALGPTVQLLRITKKNTISRQRTE